MSKRANPMSSCRRVRILRSLLVMAVLSACPVAEPAGVLEIRHQERSLQPGEVVLLTVNGTLPLQRAEALVFGRSFRLSPRKDARVWSGLVGIDLETRPGAYAVEVRAGQEDGTTVTGTDELIVRAKRFPTRRLTLDEKFVTPPPEVGDRIRLESARLNAIHASVTPEMLWSGVFKPPVPADPGSSFGKRSILNDKPRSPHSGVDFSVPEGTEVRAPNAGRIVLAADLYYTGLTVILDHGLGIYSLFAHMSGINVAEGDAVRTGDLVGHVGMTGRSTGPHLHWGVRLMGTRVDPMALIAVTAARLGPPARKKQ